MRRIVLGIVVGLVAGCSDEISSNSNDVSTRDLAIPFSLTGSAAKTTIQGSFLGPGGLPLRLVEGDRVELRSPVGTLPIAIPNGGFTLDLPPVGGDFELALLRPPGRGGDVELAAYLAPPFAITVPATASRAATLTVAWDAAIGPHATILNVGGPCVVSLSRTLASDVGTYTFNRYELSSSAASPGTCTVTIEMVKVWPANNPSYYQSTQKARVTLEMTP